MKVTVIGNCQIGPIRKILRAVHSNLETTNFPAVQDLNESHRVLVEQDCKNADWIFAQPVNNNYKIFLKFSEFLYSSNQSGENIHQILFVFREYDIFTLFDRKTA